jgi:hypothetical protein
MWCIPRVDGEYVARMEDVLDLYAEAPDPKRPMRTCAERRIANSELTSYQTDSNQSMNTTVLRPLRITRSSR